MRPGAEITPERARRLGWATLAALLLAIVGSWHGLSFLAHPLSNNLSGAAALWMLIDLVGAVLGCVLAVVYLRHIYRSPSAPRNRTAWTTSILLLGPFAMPFYWWHYLRRTPTSPASLVEMGLITEEEARLLAAASVPGGGVPVGVRGEAALVAGGGELALVAAGPGVQEARAVPAPSVAQEQAVAAGSVAREQAVAAASVPPPAPRATA